MVVPVDDGGDGYLIFVIPVGSGYLNQFSESRNRWVQVLEKKMQSEGTAGSGIFRKLQRMVGFHERTGKDFGRLF
jgi:hypothetical protein